MNQKLIFFINFKIIIIIKIKKLILPQFIVKR